MTPGRSSAGSVLPTLLILLSGCSGAGSSPGEVPELHQRVLIPAGLFLFGAKSDEVESYTRQSLVNFPGMVERIRSTFITPPRSENLDAFSIDEFEVTNQQFRGFLQASGYVPKNRQDFLEDWLGETYPEWAADFPVVWVSQADAAAFCEWAGGSLPTELQWEKAARGSGGQPFTWTAADFTEFPANLGSGKAEPVGNRPEDSSPFNVFDMAGNVSEWTSTTVQFSGETRAVVRGGSFGSQTRDAFVARRNLGLKPETRRADVGFRCVGPAS